MTAKAKKKHRKSKKGAGFEREFCRTLTEWWAEGPTDDVMFWRTASSGGRATLRRRLGKETVNKHCGDVTAVDPYAEPLTNLITFELKRGYQDCAQDLFDQGSHIKNTIFQDFIIQSMQGARNAGTPFWMLIHRRDNKVEMCYFSYNLWRHLSDMGCFDDADFPIIWMNVPIDDRMTEICGMGFRHFRKAVDPADLIQLERKLRNGGTTPTEDGD